jgi:hypothetical protein
MEVYVRTPTWTTWGITHTGSNGDGLRWRLRSGWDTGGSGNNFVVQGVADAATCGGLCQSYTGFTCLGFMYKFNGSHSSSKPPWADQACTLFDTLVSLSTGVPDVHSYTMFP